MFASWTPYLSWKFSLVLKRGCTRNWKSGTSVALATDRQTMFLRPANLLNSGNQSKMAAANMNSLYYRRTVHFEKEIHHLTPENQYWADSQFPLTYRNRFWGGRNEKEFLCDIWQTDKGHVKEKIDQRMALPCSQDTDVQMWIKLQNDKLFSRVCIKLDFSVVDHSFFPFEVLICLLFLPS